MPYFKGYGLTPGAFSRLLRTSGLNFYGQPLSPDSGDDSQTENQTTILRSWPATSRGAWSGRKNAPGSAEAARGVPGSRGTVSDCLSHSRVFHNGREHDTLLTLPNRRR